MAEKAPRFRNLGQSARRAARISVLALAIGGASASVLACRTTAEDVHRWAQTSQGPKRLVAVLTHDKYPIELRVEAAMTLVRMKPRGGRRIGIQGSDDYEGVLDALKRLTPDTRAKIVAGMAPQLKAAMLEPLPKPQGDEAVEDPSFPYKDTAYGLLTAEDGSLVDDPAVRQTLRDALIQWSSTNFEQRMDESSQIYGMQQVFRWLKEDGVRPLPNLIAPGNAKNDTIAGLIADLGDKAAKLSASNKLVAIAREVDTEAWVKKRAPSVEAANKASGLTPTKEQFQAQLDQYQEEELLRVFQSMQKVGQAPVVDYLLAYARDSKNPEKRRANALASLEGHLERNNPAHADAILSLLSDDTTPDLVRGVAVKRVGELPRDKVIDKLYALFKNPRWQIRWVAADLILRMSETKHVDEFMSKLEKTEGMAMSEPLIYGPSIGEMKGTPKPIVFVEKYASAGHPVEQRLAALGYYYRHGTKADLAKLDQYASDSQKVPECAENATDCEWKCTIQVNKKPEPKEVATVGDFVNYCIKPAIESRASANAEPKEQK